MPGDQQTASLILDVDKDGRLDFVVTERTRAPSVVWFQRTAGGWTRRVIDDSRMRIEAGGAFWDIDRDGDVDLVFGGDASSNQIWWWENPLPDYNVGSWRRRLIKDSGPTKHHDQLIGDFDGDGKVELVFWNQGAKSLCRATVPDDPKAGCWAFAPIYRWQDGREHEGLAANDVDGDGKLDVVGGGNWYRHTGGTSFAVETVDANMRFTRAAAGQLKKGGRPEIVFVPGDADGPLVWYEWTGQKWQPHQLLERVIHGHSLQLADVNGDGLLDVFVAEMAQWGKTVDNEAAKARVFLGDGKGGFHVVRVSTGFGNHESKLADLDGDGDLDILGKPYHWRAPRLDIWLNNRIRRP
jgi:hypothetical protein